MIDGIIETAFRLNLDLDNRKEWSMKMFPSAEEGSRNQYFQGQFMKLTAPVFFEVSGSLIEHRLRLNHRHRLREIFWMNSLKTN